MKLVKAFLFMLVVCMGHAQFPLPVPTLNGVQEGIMNRPPEFFTMGWEKGLQLGTRETGMFIEVDSIGQQNIALLVDREQHPVLYTSEIETPVCADGECKLMHIRLYWTLLGDYAGFDRYPQQPLTKHDHDEFVQADYLKLHQLLLDDKSIFRQRKIDELVKKPSPSDHGDVDALSGATIAEVKESVVSGALYSCYVAWHLVHGEIAGKLKEHTLGLLDKELILRMLHNEDPDYQMFALEKLAKEEYLDHLERIATIFKSSIPLVRSYIIKNLPEEFWNIRANQIPFWDAFSNIDINSRSLLLEHLEEAPESSIVEVSNKLGSMSKNQLRLFLDFLAVRNNEPEILENLKVFANKENEIYAYLVLQFIEDY